VRYTSRGFLVSAIRGPLDVRLLSCGMAYLTFAMLLVYMFSRAKWCMIIYSNQITDLILISFSCILSYCYITFYFYFYFSLLFIYKHFSFFCMYYCLFVEFYIDCVYLCIFALEGIISQSALINSDSSSSSALIKFMYIF